RPTACTRPAAADTLRAAGDRANRDWTTESRPGVPRARHRDWSTGRGLASLRRAGPGPARRQPADSGKLGGPRAAMQAVRKEAPQAVQTGCAAALGESRQQTAGKRRQA